MLPPPSLVAALLCGGRSSRFGPNKALAGIDGVPMIASIVRHIQPVVPELLLVTNTPHDYAFLNLPFLTDSKPYAGPLAALLTVFEKTSYDEVLLVACDMPYLDPKLIESLLHHTPEANACVLRDTVGPQYLLARYSRRLVGPLRSFAGQGGNSFKDFFRQHPSGLHFLPSEKEIPNVNTQKDLENFNAL